jgi:alkanesulfonate monooxygenase SsuD/methylene tetrahydromethanopterin reductase-like flavin-dependent oxidoreductase (luciferase family)
VVRGLPRGGSVDFHGEVINLDQGRSSFVPHRSAIPIYVASNGPLGQRVAEAVADGAIMEACASGCEAQAFSGEITASASQAGRDPKSVKRIIRLNTCVAGDGQAARRAVRPSVARYLGAGRLRSRTLEMQGGRASVRGVGGGCGGPLRRRCRPVSAAAATDHRSPCRRADPRWNHRRSYRARRGAFGPA